ncbi:MAG: hypothetical protein ACRCU3_10540 [Eubacteriaceae bacterium]
MKTKKIRLSQRVVAILICLILIIGNLETIASVKGAQEDTTTPQEGTQTFSTFQELQEFQNNQPSSDFESEVVESQPSEEVVVETAPQQQESILESIPEENNKKIIYLNPEKKLQPGEKASTTMVPGNDKANGETPETPLLTIEAALEKAKEFKEKENSNSVIVVMNPIEIKEKENKTLKGFETTLISWEGREDQSEIIFSFTGGTLTLSDLILEKRTEDLKTNLIHMKEGILKLEEKNAIKGNVFLDYMEAKKTKTPPSIQVLKPLETHTKFTININADNDTQNQPVIKGLYPSQEIEEDFLTHFSLNGDEGTEVWSLNYDEKDETKKTIILKNETLGGVPAQENNPEESNIAMMAAPRALANIVYWNVNPVTVSQTESSPRIIGGNDENSGMTPNFPVLTWERAKERLGSSQGTIVIMNTVVIGDEHFVDGSGNPITNLDGNNNITLSQWVQYPQELFVIPPTGGTFTLKNIILECFGGGVAVRLADNLSGFTTTQLEQLIIDANVIIRDGYIQTDLNPTAPQHLVNPTILLTQGALNTPVDPYGVNFIGIDGNEVFNHANVIQGPAGSRAQEYVTRFILHPQNANQRWNLVNDPEQENSIELSQTFVWTGVYLNGQDGNDDWFGGNCDYPVKTFDKAKEILYANWEAIPPESRNVYICDTVDINSYLNWNFIAGGGTIDRSDEAFVKVCPTHVAHTRFHTELPTTLVSVKRGGTLNIQSLTMAYDQRKTDHVMIEVLPGGNTNLSFKSKLMGSSDFYHGTGVKVIGGGTEFTNFYMLSGSSSISQKSLGVSLSGNGLIPARTKFEMVNGSITNNSRQDVFGLGGGVYVENAQFYMVNDAAEIANNTALSSPYHGSGGGIYATGNSIVTIRNGKITGNKTNTSNSTSPDNLSYGAGICMTGGTLTLEAEGEVGRAPDIGHNTFYAGKGAGVYVGPNAKMIVGAGSIHDNTITGGVTQDYGATGAGIAVDNGELVFNNGEVSYNGFTNEGITGYHRLGAGIGITGDSGKVTMNNGLIKGNRFFTWGRDGTDAGGGIGAYRANTGLNADALTFNGGLVELNVADQGGGIYCYEASLNFDGNSILNMINSNRARTEGGGLFSENSPSLRSNSDIAIGGNYALRGGGLYIKNLEEKFTLQAGLASEQAGVNIYANASITEGGGVYLDNSKIEFGSNVKIINGAAETSGGAIYCKGETSSILVPDGMYVAENTAGLYGGGFYLQEGTLGIKGGYFENNNASQGSTLYSGDNGTAYLMGGTFMSNHYAADGYGIVVNLRENATGKTHIDPERLTMEEGVYINNRNSSLSLLGAITDVRKSIPIHVNPDQLYSGSKVVVPSNISSVNILDNVYTFNGGNALINAAPYASFFTGPNQVLPHTTRIVGVNPNIILNGEGVYLDGTNGSDTNGGTSPTDAVATFSRAKTLLEQQIAQAKLDAVLPVEHTFYDPNGFEPYIYICGKVTTEELEEWELDYDAVAFDQSQTVNTEGRIINTTQAQIKRHGAYMGVMVNVGDDGGRLLLKKLLMDGNGVAISATSEMIEVDMGSQLLTLGPHIYGNYTHGIVGAGSIVLMDARSEENNPTILKNHGGFAIKISGLQARINASENSQIINGIYIDNDPEKGIVPGANLEETGGVQIGDISGLDSYTYWGNFSDNTVVDTPGRIGVALYGGEDGDTKNLSFQQSSKITRSKVGILSKGKGSRIEFSSNAKIEGAETGVFVDGEDDSILLRDDSKIITTGDNVGVKTGENVKDSQFSLMHRAELKGDGEGKGIEFIGTGNQNGTFSLAVGINNNSKITGYHTGLYYSTNSGRTTVNLRQSGQIGGNTGYGVLTADDHPTGGENNVATSPVINLFDDAVIGGATLDEGNGSGGVHLQSSLNLNMTGHSKIAFNHGDGIQMGWASDALVSRGGKIKLEEQAFIEKNTGNGINSWDYTTPDSDVKFNPVTIDLAGDSRIIENGGKGVILSQGSPPNVIGGQSTLTLGKYTQISNNVSYGIGNAIDAYGKIRLDGGATVDGEIYLRDFSKPISLIGEILSNHVPFKVGVVHNFVGKKLVIPEGGVSSAASYYSKFEKTQNFPRDKFIVPQEPNLVVEGENNVYWAGSGPAQGGLVPGNDANDGGSPGSPVASFDKAVDVLKTLEPGANIIICNYAIKTSDFMTEGRVHWILDDDGRTVTNEQGETWVPKVLRYANDGNFFTGNMVEHDAPGSLELVNIIFDGNAGYSWLFTTGAIISCSSGGEITLSNAVVQNNIKTGRNMRGGGIDSNGDVIVTVGGEIVNNGLRLEYEASNAELKGGGVYAKSLETLGGKIENNIIYSETGGDNVAAYGGGAFIEEDIFITPGPVGTSIGYNKVYGTDARGSAIYLDHGNATLIGASILNNINESFYRSTLLEHKTKGTIFVRDADSFNLVGGEIKGNQVVNSGVIGDYEESSAFGGGIYFEGQRPMSRGTLTIDGTTIEENICIDADAQRFETGGKGGGIYMEGGTLQFRNGSIKNNKANQGGGIYYTGKQAELTGGNISGNAPIFEALEPKGVHSGVYVGAPNFILKGGGCVVDDRIYLTSPENNVTLGGALYQSNLLYRLELSPSFGQGDIVVKPDNLAVTNAGGYLRYFGVTYPGYSLQSQEPNLILSKHIFIDSINGDDGNLGTSPRDSVMSFEQAKFLGGSGNYVIYASGPVAVTGTENWDLPESANLCRYTGFPVAHATDIYPVYTGPIVVTDNGDNLNIGNMKILGRRQTESPMDGEALVKVGTGSTVTMNGNASLSLNSAAMTSPSPGVHIDGGQFNLYGGTLNQLSGGIGTAIYQNGGLDVKNRSTVVGEIYLTGTGGDDATSRHITSDTSYVPASGRNLSINIENPFGTRNVVEYPLGQVATAAQQEYYQLSPEISSVYGLGKRTVDTRILELKEKAVVYIDGVNGVDGNNGNSPAEAIKTLEKAYNLLSAEGGHILVVDAVTINVGEEITLKNSNSGTVSSSQYINEGSQITTGGLVSFQRYAKPTAWESFSQLDQLKYNVESYEGELFTVLGTLNLEGMIVDGHSRPVYGNPKLASQGIEANKPILNVDSGRVNATHGTSIQWNKSLSTEGSAGVLILQGGAFKGDNFSISNMELPYAQGSAITTNENANCYLSGSIEIQGDIYLRGNGSPGNTSSSGIIEILGNGFSPNPPSLSIILEDIYLGRPVIKYANGFIPQRSDNNIYHFQEAVTNAYTLVSNPGNPALLELQNYSAVYVDGVDGNDGNTGNTPVDSVKTLKKAYEILRAMGGGHLVVVNEVSIDEQVYLSGNKYDNDGLANPIVIDVGMVDIRRYVLPDAQSINLAFTQRQTYLGSLFTVKQGSSLTLENIEISGLKDGLLLGDPFQDVNRTTEANAPLIQVNLGSVLNLKTESVLKDNNNGGSSINGGAIKNEGTLLINGGKLTGNTALKGAGVYQFGLMTINSGTQGLMDQEIYLGTENSGTLENPSWGRDFVINTQEWVDATVKLTVNVDHPVEGRKMVVYDDPSAFTPPLDSMYDRFILGDTITTASQALFLVGSSTLTNTLVLETYGVLDVSIPSEIFLLAVEYPPNSGWNPYQLRNSTMMDPVYTIANHGDYSVQVVMESFSLNNPPGSQWDPMIIANSDTIGDFFDESQPDLNQRIGLAIITFEGGIFLLGDTNQEMETLGLGEEGNFYFIGIAAPSFFEKYEDADLNYSATIPNVNEYIKNNARAKFKMVYKLQLVR